MTEQEVIENRGGGHIVEKISNVRNLDVYKMAFSAAMEIYTLSRAFPDEEQQALGAQIRETSRSVCVNISIAWKKRRHRNVYLNKLQQAQQEAVATQTWLQFAKAGQYISLEQFNKLDDQYDQIFSQLFTLERKADSFSSG